MISLLAVALSPVAILLRLLGWFPANRSPALLPTLLAFGIVEVTLLISSSILVAATNHPQSLDRAIFRRFGLVVEYSLPTPEQARAVIRNRLVALNTRGLSWQRIDGATHGLSHAELTIACEQAAKQTILSKAPRVTTDVLVTALDERRRSSVD